MNERPNLDAAALQIKQIHSAGGSPLTKNEIDLVQRHYGLQIYLGMPQTSRVLKDIELLMAASVRDPAEQAIRKQCGRKPKCAPTQYDVSRQRWSGPYQRLIRLPALRKGTGYLDHALLERLLLTYHLQGTPRHKLVAKVLDHLEQQHPKLPLPDPRTLRRLLATALPNSPG
ncbi:hypothetical protein [Ralstonia sp. SET104]|uniref:hypothetical protein n=1 Tax=Ralstonia sp. SET104 TaxID=2448774 RepID=UPI000F584116|nr:hypothetical protein [Ralstonia sp. SET104]GCB06761.1 hypothetical protein PSUB009319_43920 [Ralstonia sp. SET104]